MPVKCFAHSLVCTKDSVTVALVIPHNHLSRQVLQPHLPEEESVGQVSCPAIGAEARDSPALAVSTTLHKTPDGSAGPSRYAVVVSAEVLEASCPAGSLVIILQQDSVRRQSQESMYKAL